MLGKYFSLERYRASLKALKIIESNDKKLPPLLINLKGINVLEDFVDGCNISHYN
jgi:hypothetical protein